MARAKKAISALLSLMALSVVVRCGDRDEDEEDRRQIERRANTYVQEMQLAQAPDSSLTLPNLL